ncbi:hypothetical protein CF326_g9070 [Tilletia indica]|nr:hypothetical protein CF326_g9070 [Tilletia indica]
MCMERVSMLKTMDLILAKEDPREALLKYADPADTDRKWTSAWKATQPKAVFRDDDGEDDDEKAEKEGQKSTGRR